MLPEHCIIDNDNHLTIEDVDKTFYIEMAKKRINDFLGIKPEKKPRGRKTTDTPKEPRRKSQMATAKTAATKDTTALNAFQKVLMARVKFLEAGAKKTGKNMSLSFRYFELDDIIPVATPIFMELGLLPVVTFTEEVATMTIVNTDKPEDSVVFFSPMRVPESNRGTNPVMALGSAHTFLNGARSAWESVKTVFGNVASFFKDTFQKAWQGIVNVFSVAGEIFVNIKDGILSGFKKVVNGIIGGLNSAIAIPFNGINSALRTIKNINILGLTPFSGLRTISVPSIPYLADGGMVNAGQMFVAREAGPELVGTIGNKTAVVNNDQMWCVIQTWLCSPTTIMWWKHCPRMRI